MVENDIFFLIQKLKKKNPRTTIYTNMAALLNNMQYIYFTFFYLALFTAGLIGWTERRGESGGTGEEKLRGEGDLEGVFILRGEGEFLGECFGEVAGVDRGESSAISQNSNLEKIQNYQTTFFLKDFKSC